MAWSELQRSGRWRGMYRDATGRRRSAGMYPTKAEADRKAAVAEDKARSDPNSVDPRDGRMTWGTWVEQWWPRRAVEPGTDLREITRRRKHLDPRWGAVALTAIRREDVQQWVLDLERSGLSASSVGKCYHLLSSSLRAAVLDRKITVSPCQAIRTPIEPDGNERFFTHDEVDAICRSMREPYRTMVVLLVGTGLRWGEAAGLHWHRVNLDEGWVDVHEVWDHKVGEMKPYPKGRHRRRVWLPDWLVAELDRHRDTYPPGLSCRVPHRGRQHCRSGLVIGNEVGRPLDYASFRHQHWGRAVGRWMWQLADGREYATRGEARRRKGGDRAVRVWREGLAGVGFGTIHDLRHTFASWALQADPPMPMLDLSIALGHSSVKITERYSHLADTSRERFRAALAWPGRTQAATRTPRGGDVDGALVIDSRERFRSSDGA